MTDGQFLGAQHLKWTERRVSRKGDATRILIVDDYTVGAEALAAALSSDGYETRFAFSGMQALQEIGVWIPHIIVLDINMPEHDGFATARVFRGIGELEKAAIIAFTALSAINVIDKARRAGFDAYCQKGATLERLQVLIDGFVI